MNPEDRLRALKDSDRWTVNALEPRKNPFGETKPTGRRQSFRMIVAEVAIVAAVAGIVFGAIALQNQGAEEIATTPTPTPTQTVAAAVPLVGGTIMKSTGEPWESGVPIELLVWPAVETDVVTLEVVASAVTGEDGTFAFTIDDVGSLEQYVRKPGNIVDFEIEGSSGKEMASWNFSRALVDVDGVLSVIDASWESLTPADRREQARTGLTGVSIVSLYTGTTPDPPAVEERLSVVLSTKSVQVKNSSGEVLGKYKYFEEDGDEVVAALTEAFGTEPEKSAFANREHTPPGEKFEWDGLELYVYDKEINYDIGYARFRLIVTASEVDGVVIETVDGIAVGSSVADLSAAADNTTKMDVDDGWDSDGIQYHLDERVISGSNYTDVEGDPGAWSTMVMVPDGDTEVERIYTPHINFGP